MAGWNFEEILQHLKKKNTRKIEKIFLLVECDGWLFVCVKLAGVGLNVCECAGKAQSRPGRWVSSHSCLAKVL